MTDQNGVSKRFQDGEEVEVAEILGRLAELEDQFENWVYISNNGWLVTALDGNADARELMFLRELQDHLDGIETEAVVLARDEFEMSGNLLARFEGRYAPDGCVYSVAGPTASMAR